MEKCVYIYIYLMYVQQPRQKSQREEAQRWCSTVKKSFVMESELCPITQQPCCQSAPVPPPFTQTQILLCWFKYRTHTSDSYTAWRGNKGKIRKEGMNSGEKEDFTDVFRGSMKENKEKWDKMGRNKEG